MLPIVPAAQDTALEARHYVRRATAVPPPRALVVPGLDPMVGQITGSLGDVSGDYDPAPGPAPGVFWQWAGPAVPVASRSRSARGRHRERQGTRSVSEIRQRTGRRGPERLTERFGVVDQNAPVASERVASANRRAQ